MTRELAPKYDPKEVEERWYRIWEQRGDFACRPGSGRAPFSIVIPPPNVTGSLHIGHALNNTLQDLLARRQRMRGFDVLWVPGCDHAGIATHTVVERELAKEGKTREGVGREEFLRRVWQWKELSGGTIMRQLRRLGASCDWSHERFTMDEGLSAAVREAFIHLYDKGLIYQGDYIVNWCPRCGTALSDIEAEHKDEDGKLYYVRYPVTGRPGTFVVVATTRPETLPGDVAVAAHPQDPRYAGLKGATLVLPLFGRALPLLFDAAVDRDFGTGALKITPAHDANDFQVGESHGLERVKVMDQKGVMNAAAGKYAGLDRFACRKAIVADLEAAGLLEKVEDYHHAVARCYRCETVVESMLSLQWFVRMKPLAEKALAALAAGETTIRPGNWAKVYSDRLRGIKDWCISRQIWWGHRIPVYRAPDGSQAAARSSAEAAAKLGVAEGALKQDPDVLDTWFSSGLWPFSTLGWPERTADLARYFPTSTLVSGWDILIIWVTNMSMLSLELTGTVPFRTVQVHSLVADEHGRKMSKSKGNVIDPLLKIDDIGADALRLGLCTVETQSRYISLSEERLQTARNFTNKVWNAARFMLMHLQGLPEGAPVRPQAGPLELVDRWILERLDRVTDAVNRFLDDGLQVNQAAESLTHFFWDDLCDWYIEAVKPRLAGQGGAARSAAQATLAYVLERTLRLLHPICPFMTEEIWQLLPHEGRSIAQAPWPEAPAPAAEGVRALEGFGQVMDVVRAVRALRAELKVDAKREVRVVLSVSGETRRLLEPQLGLMKTLARMDAEFGGPGLAPPKDAATQLAGEVQVFLPREGLLDRDAERVRLGKERQKLENLLQSQRAKLSNQAFRSKAPQAVVNLELAKEGELKSSLDKIGRALESLGA